MAGTAGPAGPVGGLPTLPPGPPAGPLAAPPGTRALAGTVSLEAGYALAHGGSLLSDTGGSILKLGADAALIANNGGNLISNNGGGLVSNNGGGLISDQAAALVGKAKYGLLQAAAAPPPGTMWPAGGMALRAIDLATGATVPLGPDAQGRPAFEVITNDRGAFQVHLPAAGADRVRLQAFPPGGTDARLFSAGLALDQATRRDLDEDTAQVAGYIREIFAGATLANVKRQPEEVPGQPLLLLAGTAEREPMEKGWQHLIVALKQARMPERSRDEQRAVAYRLADLCTARMDLLAVRIQKSDGILGYGGPEEGAVAAITDVFTQQRAKIAATMTRVAGEGGDPAAHFADKPWLKSANERAETPFQILKPADFNDYLTRAYLANDELDEIPKYLELASVLKDKDVHVKGVDPFRIAAASRAIYLDFMRTLYVGERPVIDEIEAYLAKLPPPGALLP